MEGVRQVPALFQAKVGTGDTATVSKSVQYRYGYIDESELGLVDRRTTRIYPTASVARASCGQNANIIKVKVERVNG